MYQYFARKHALEHKRSPLLKLNKQKNSNVEQQKSPQHEKLEKIEVDAPNNNEQLATKKLEL